MNGCCPSSCTNENDSDCSATCGNGTIDPGETCDGDCNTTCNDDDACTTDQLTGSAANCTASCSFVPITACQGGDGCCPSGCNSDNDSDCEEACGNGVIDPGETCDGDCRTSCSDNNACTADSISGSPSTCDVVCTNTRITACQTGDGCCPSGCTYSTDRDCPCTPAVCGSAGRECGSPADGCGGTLSCGNCPAGFTCSNFTCVPVSSGGNIGDACTQDVDCPTGGYCGTNPNFKDGYCSKSCMLDNDCPGGSHCGNKSNGTGECLKNCTTDNDCRSGYECWNYDGDQMPISECAPSGVGTKPVGASCQGVWECDGGTLASCLVNDAQTATYCSVDCDSIANPCPTGSVCDGSLFLGGICLAECDPNNPTCRTGFSCTLFSDILSGDMVHGCAPD